MRCQGQSYTPDYQVISPTNGRMYQRTAGGYLTPCAREAQVHVHLEYCDGTIVQKSMCAACAEAWQSAVNQRFAYLQPLWTITPIAQGVTV